MAEKISKASTQPAGKRGRPSDYSVETATAICDRLMRGESLRSICASEGMPNRDTVFSWLARHKEFHGQYARAREVQADRLFEECLEISDEKAGDYVEREMEDGAKSLHVDHEYIQRSRLRVDTRKWMAGKLAPKKYGERLEHGFSDPEGNSVAPVINFFGRPEHPPASKAVGGDRQPGNRAAIRRGSRGRKESPDEGGGN